MNERNPFADFEVIDAYGLDDAIADGVVIPVAESATAVAEPAIKPLHQIGSMDEYLQNFGKILGKKAVTSLDPLHIPGSGPLPEFAGLLRQPFPCQQHAIAAAVKMMDEVVSGFLVGEMGTGKTLMGMVATYMHAARSRKQGGHGGKFRVLVLCPDHLIGKWKREIEETIPDAKVYYFGPITEEEAEARKATDPRGGQALALADLMRLIDEAKVGNRWNKPGGPEYYVLGRNQAKWYPDWLGTSDPYVGFNGRRTETAVSSRIVIVDRVPMLDENDKPVYDKLGMPKMQNVTARVFACPHCGTVARDRKGLPLSAKDISKKKVQCEGRYLQQAPSPEKTKEHGRDRICPLPKRFHEAKVGHEVNFNGHRYVVRECKEPLWCFTSKPYRWAPARIIQKKMRRFFHYLLIDECHEQKSDESAQSMACGKLIAAADHTIALTGTIIGGYADHLYPLMMRIAPSSLREEGFEWGKDLAFSEVYGRIDRIVTVKEEGATPTVGKSVRSMRRAKSGKATERKAVRPGIMPTLFGKHMIGNSIFITLDEMADELPNLHEYIGGFDPSCGDDPFYVDACCEMRPDQKAEYDRIEATLNFACKELLKRGSMKLLGTMLWTTLGWPDYCYAEWGKDDELAKAIKAVEAELREEAEREGREPKALPVPHTVGYWDKPGNKKLDNWMGVVTPAVLDDRPIYPKEEALVDICLRHKAAGNQVWVYAQMTQKRNVTVRLQSILRRHGLTVGIMRSDDVDPKEREDWIARHGREFDVMICHPKLVSTGLDLFSKAQGGHNYNAIVFYQTGYNLFDMRQAARRSWRIGQPRDCYVYYLYYQDTMQHRAMSLMSKKMAAAQALEGEFSEDGLAAMAGEDNLQMALAKSLAAKIDDSDMQRSWSKIKSGEKKKARRPTDILKPKAGAEPAKPSPLDDLPIEAQMAAATILDRQEKPTPAGAVADIDAFAAMLAQADAGMWAAARRMGEGVQPEPVMTEAEYREMVLDTLAAESEPEPEPDDLDGEQDEADTGLARPGDLPADDEVETPEPEPEAKAEPVVLKVHRPEPEPVVEKPKILDDVEMPEFYEELLAKMFANLAAHGMTLSDLAS